MLMRKRLLAVLVLQCSFPDANPGAMCTYVNISFLFYIMHFQSHLDSFCQRFRRMLYFCDNSGPLPNVILSTLYFKYSLLNWRLKFMERTECLQNCRLYRTIISNYSGEVKLKLIEKLWTSEDFSAPDLCWENIILWGCAAWSYHCIQKRW